MRYVAPEVMWEAGRGIAGSTRRKNGARKTEQVPDWGLSVVEQVPQVSSPVAGAPDHVELVVVQTPASRLPLLVRVLKVGSQRRPSQKMVVESMDRKIAGDPTITESHPHHRLGLVLVVDRVERSHREQAGKSEAHPRRLLDQIGYDICRKQSPPLVRIKGENPAALVEW